LSLNTRSNFSGSKTRSRIPRTMTLTGLRAKNFSKHSPNIITLAPGVLHCCGAFRCYPYHSKTSEITKDSHLYRDSHGGPMNGGCAPEEDCVDTRHSVKPLHPGALCHTASLTPLQVVAMAVRETATPPARSIHDWSTRRPSPAYTAASAWPSRSGW